MDRMWWVRFSVAAALVVAAVFVVWPSVSTWVPAPAWVTEHFKSKIAPGLDIRGGLRLAYEVEVDEAIVDLRDTRADQLVDRLAQALGVTEEGDTPTREQLDQVRARVQIRKEAETRITLQFQQAADAAKLTAELLDTQFGDLREVSREGNRVVLDIRADRLERIREQAVEQAKQTVASRIDELGLRETSVSSRDQEIIVEIPGADEAAFDRIRGIISRTARLEFKIVDDETNFTSAITELPEGITKESENTSAGTSRPNVVSTFFVARGAGSRQKLADFVAQLQRDGRIPEDRSLLLSRFGGGRDGADEAWRTYLLFSRAEITGDLVEDAFVANDPQTNRPEVSIKFSQPQGADTFERLTSRNIKRRMAIVLDDRVESAPVIQVRIPGGSARITLGSYEDYTRILNEASDLVIVLKAGALPAPIRPSNEQLIGPTLGRDAVQKGALGAALGVGFVLIFMAAYYSVVGLVADVMVVLNLLFLFAILAFFEATLTLPGIAGVALTVGMAVDANVLINERIREELRAGKSARTAVEQGYGRAFVSIMDSQLTTFIAGVVLYQYGTGPIKGFAVTLMIGIITSVFSAVFCSRIMMDWIVRGLRVQQLRIG